MKNGVFSVSLAVGYLILNVAGLATGYAQHLEITSPQSGSRVAGEVIEVRGRGAAAAGASIKISVLTNQWYPQEGKATINADGSWTYAPCHLSGQGTYNNHSIKAELVGSNNRVLSTATVDNIVRNN